MPIFTSYPQHVVDKKAGAGDKCIRCNKRLTKPRSSEITAAWGTIGGKGLGYGYN
jgi:hypothetical protein